MRPVRLGLIGSVVAAMVVLAGCTDGDAPARDRAAAGGDTVASAQPTVSGTAPNAETTASCATISKDIAATMAKVAEAEKIGPPAGHLAVSAQFSAGAAGLYAHTFTPSTAVNDAAKQVATAMSELADTYGSAPKAKPSRTGLDQAVAQLRSACAAS